MHYGANLSLVGAPRIPAILERWRCLVTRDVMLLQHPAPFVKGCFTIHVSMYPGVQQLRSGLLQPITLATPHRRVSYHPYLNRCTSKETSF